MTFFSFVKACRDFNWTHLEFPQFFHLMILIFILLEQNYRMSKSITSLRNNYGLNQQIIAVRNVTCLYLIVRYIVVSMLITVIFPGMLKLNLVLGKNKHGVYKKDNNWTLVVCRNFCVRLFYSLTKLSGSSHVTKRVQFGKQICHPSK